jgi:hypothetical protein
MTATLNIPIDFILSFGFNCPGFENALPWAKLFSIIGYQTPND